jgi:hypothetical protein
MGALLGAAAALVWERRARLSPPAPASAPEARQRELREKLAGAVPAEPAAEAPAPDMAAADVPAAEPPKPPEPPPPTPPPPESETKPAPPAPPRSAATPAASPVRPGPPPSDEFEAMRRRIHEEGKAAAEEMRKAPDEAS